MAEMPTKVSIGSLLKDAKPSLVTLTIRVTGLRWFVWRLRLATLLIRAASWMCFGGLKMEIVEHAGQAGPDKDGAA
jgi:hypothetical protein